MEVVPLAQAAVAGAGDLVGDRKTHSVDLGVAGLTSLTGTAVSGQSHAVDEVVPLTEG